MLARQFHDVHHDAVFPLLSVQLACDLRRQWRSVRVTPPCARGSAMLSITKESAVDVQVFGIGPFPDHRGCAAGELSNWYALLVLPRVRLSAPPSGQPSAHVPFLIDARQLFGACHRQRGSASQSDVFPNSQLAMGRLRRAGRMLQPSLRQTAKPRQLCQVTSSDVRLRAGSSSLIPDRLMSAPPSALRLRQFESIPTPHTHYVRV